MRKQGKYTKFERSTLFFNTYPVSRILNFNRPKWTKLQKTLKLKQTKPFDLQNNQLTKLNYKLWDKVQTCYKKGHDTRLSLNLLFDFSISISYYKKILRFSNITEKRAFIIKSLIKPFFRFDILLWKSGLTSSLYEARQLIFCGKVFLNNKKIKNICYLQKGDVISFQEKFISNKLYNLTNLQNFIEIDFYTKNIILVKNEFDFSDTDISLVINELIPIKNFYDYIKIQ